MKRILKCVVNLKVSIPVLVSISELSFDYLYRYWPSSEKNLRQDRTPQRITPFLRVVVTLHAHFIQGLVRIKKWSNEPSVVLNTPCDLKIHQSEMLNTLEKKHIQIQLANEIWVTQFIQHFHFYRTLLSNISIEHFFRTFPSNISFEQIFWLLQHCPQSLVTCTKLIF